MYEKYKIVPFYRKVIVKFINKRAKSLFMIFTLDLDNGRTNRHQFRAKVHFSNFDR